MLFSSNVLDSTSTIVELGCGISALNALCLDGAVAEYVLTDQPYVARLVAQNLAANRKSNNHDNDNDNNTVARRVVRRGPARTALRTAVRFVMLDWERNDAASAVPQRGADVVLACDCVYNDALVRPLVDTCADVCRVRDEAGGSMTVCVVAQQLRHADVFAMWMEAALEKFRVWRVPEEKLPEALQPQSGLVVHVAVLRVGDISDR